MQPDVAEQLGHLVRELRPKLDVLGFHVNSFGLRETGRFEIAYDEPTDVPGVLVDAIARVTRVDVDFVNARTVSIAEFETDTLLHSQPWRDPQSLEDLLAERQC